MKLLVPRIAFRTGIYEYLISVLQADMFTEHECVPPVLYFYHQSDFLTGFFILKLNVFLVSPHLPMSYWF